MSYYLSNTINVGTTLNPIRKNEYWKFERKIDRDNAVLCITGAYPQKKTGIPENTEIKIFHRFKDIGYTVSCLKMIEK